MYSCNNIISDSFHWFRTSSFFGRNLSSRSLILPFSVTFVTIIRGSLESHCHTLCIVLHCLDNTFTVRCVCVLNSRPLVYFFRFFSVYISLFCIYYLVWLCIAFFWFNCCYKKPLCEKTENWSSLEWSKAVHLFRVWLTQTLNNGYTCKSHL